MKKIPLTGKRSKGKFALIDDEDYAVVSLFKWHVHNDNGTYRAHSSLIINGKQVNIYMHRLIMNAPPNKQVDHRKHNTLDNRKANLRLCTSQQNNMNRVSHKDTTSEYKGVSWNILNKKWQVYICNNGKNKFLGCFYDERVAARAYNKKAIELFGEFACINNIKGECL